VDRLYEPPELLLPELKLRDPMLRPPPARASAAVSRTIQERNIIATPMIRKLTILLDRASMLSVKPPV
jgi:hypothetical protein